MRVVIAMPGKLAEVAEIENDLKSLQQAVGGYIETLPSWFEDVVLICNEEGKLKRMEPNRAIGGGHHRRSHRCCQGERHHGRVRRSSGIRHRLHPHCLR